MGSLRRDGQVRPPSFRNTTNANDHPRLFTRYPRRPRQQHVRFVGRAISFVQVAGPTSRGDVLPLISAASRTGHHVVDRVGVGPAVLAPVFIAHEHRMARKCSSTMVWHLDHIAKANHQRITQNEALGPKHGSVVLDELGLFGEHEARRPTGRHHAERLVCRI